MLKIFKHLRNLLLTLVFSVALVACSGGGGGGNSPAASDTTPPEPVAGSSLSTSADISGNAITLNWTNPTDTDFAGVVIVRSLTANPTSITDGTTIYTGIGNSYNDTGLINGTTYYYTIFSFDGIPNYSAGAYTNATPVRPTSKWDVSTWDAPNSEYEPPISSGTWDTTNFQ